MQAVSHSVTSRLTFFGDPRQPPGDFFETSRRLHARARRAARRMVQREAASTASTIRKSTRKVKIPRRAEYAALSVDGRIAASFLLGAVVFASMMARPLVSYMLSGSTWYGELGVVCLALVTMAVLVVVLSGFVFVDPDYGLVTTTDDGAYAGSLRASGWWYISPFVSRRKVSLRVERLAISDMEVHDASGTMLNVSAVINWKVGDLSRVVLDGSPLGINAEKVLRMHCEAAFRRVMQRYAYHGTALAPSLRSHFESVDRELAGAINEGIFAIGLKVVEVHVIHLVPSGRSATATAVGALFTRD